MSNERKTPQDIDEYIAGFPSDVQEILQQIRMTIRELVPDAGERISYQIPTITLKGKNLVHFAAFKQHVSLYPAPRGYEGFREELSAYKGGKGTVQFPLDKPIPFDLITRIVKFKVQENLSREVEKAKKK